MIRRERNGRATRHRDLAEMTARLLDRRMTIDIAEPCPAWRIVRGRRALCAEAARAALGAAPPGWNAGSAAVELSIVLGDDALLRRLNRQWRGQDKATNVLSFPAQDALAAGAPPAGMPLPLGDVVLAFGTAEGEAAAQGKTLADHLAHLVVHGVLHLLGLDHAQEAEAERMEALEIAVLAGIGIADPYRDGIPAAEARHG
jgi:probable rRNA maturation factor